MCFTFPAIRFAVAIAALPELIVVRLRGAVVNVTLNAGKLYPMESLYDRRRRLRVQGDRTAPLYVDMLWEAPLVNRSLFQEGVRVRVRADLPLWYGVMSSWWYQLGCRWLAAAIYGAAFALSTTYLVQHSALIRARNRSAKRTGWRLLSQTMSQITLIHLALLMSVMKNGVLMFNSALGGYMSVGTMPYEIQMFLATGLIGFENSVLIITARYWHQVISKSEQRPGSHAWSGPVAVVLSLFAIFADSAVGVLLSTYQPSGYQHRTTVSMMVLLYTFVTFVYFICSLARFQLQLRRNQVVSNADGRLGEFARRLSVRASWLTASLLGHLLCVATFGSNARFQRDALPFGIVVVWLNIVLSLRSTFSVWMLQPRRQASTTATLASPQVTARQKSSPSADGANRKAAVGSGKTSSPDNATTTASLTGRLSNVKLLPQSQV